MAMSPNPARSNQTGPSHPGRKFLSSLVNKSTQKIFLKEKLCFIRPLERRKSDDKLSAVLLGFQGLIP